MMTQHQRHSCQNRLGTKAKILDVPEPDFVDRLTQNLSIDLGQKLLSETGQQDDAYHLHELLMERAENDLSTLPANQPSVGYITIDASKGPLWLHALEQVVRIKKWRIKMEITRFEKSVPLPAPRWVYSQEEQLLAWITQFQVEFGGRPVEVNAVYHVGPEGPLLKVDIDHLDLKADSAKSNH